MNKQIRALRADEVEARVQSATEKGAILLLYKDARCDMRILDETFGALNWKRHHEVINGKEFCTISVWDSEKNQWIEKQDCGTESNTEKEKGETSDAFKRAGTTWGIGRELYTAPFIFLNVETVKDNSRWKVKGFPKFKVTEMTVTDGKITSLKIKEEEKGKTFTWSEKQGSKTAQNNEKPKSKGNTKPKEEEAPKPQYSASHKPLICDDCGGEITEYYSASGKLVKTAKGIEEHTGGLCWNCYKSLKEAEELKNAETQAKTA
ncbi:MAG: hypothetical protein ACOX3W_00570 [Christensenellaceae bacterium]|jgi:hypothetical protein